jgi:hypothetical protein
LNSNAHGKGPAGFRDAESWPDLATLAKRESESLSAPS